MACRLSDLVGADIGKHVAENFAKDFSERIYPTALIQLLNDTKRLGEKSGAGFYKFDNRRKASPDPELAAIVAKSRKVQSLSLSYRPELSLGGKGTPNCSEHYNPRGWAST